MPGEDTKIPQLKLRYFRGKLDNHFERFVEVVRRLSINMPLLDALQVPTYSHYFKDILANKYEIATLREIMSRCPSNVVSSFQMD
jgi:pantothenate kinase